MALLRPVIGKDPPSRGARFRCPGCDCWHVIWFEGEGRPHWTRSGPDDAPTISPSVRTRFHRNGIDAPGEVGGCCHLFIREGRIQYLADCTHSLAGQTVPMEEAEP